MLLIIIIFIFLFGLCIGSFLNCLIWRLHEGENVGGRSYCPKCRAQIRWYDNIPLLSFLILRGKCRECGKPISWQYPLVELVTAVLFVVSWRIESGIMNQELGFIFSSIIHNSKFIIQIIRDWFLISVMIVVFVYDLRWWLILDIVTLPAMVVILILNILSGVLPAFGGLAGQFFSWSNFHFLCFQCGGPNLWSYLISGIIGSSFFLLQFIISRGRWIGGGDIRLGMLMGLALGWPAVLVAIFLAYFMGSIVGLALVAAGKKRWGSQIPFGTFLSTATIIVLFFGKEIVRWYLNLFQ